MKIWLTSHQSAYKLVFCLYSVNLVPKKSLITSCQLPNIAILFFSHPDFGQNHGRDVNLLHFCVNFMQVWFVYPLQSLLDFSSNRRLIVFIPSKFLYIETLLFFELCEQATWVTSSVNCQKFQQLQPEFRKHLALYQILKTFLICNDYNYRKFLTFFPGDMLKSLNLFSVFKQRKNNDKMSFPSFQNH